MTCTRKTWTVVDENGTPLTKGHSTKEAACVEAFEKGLVVQIRGRKYLNGGLQYQVTEREKQG